MSILFALKSDSVVSNLTALYPPKHLFYSGPSSARKILWLGELGADRITIVDGDADRVSQSKEQLPQNEDIEISCEVLHRNVARLPYYRTSLTSENGLIKPSELKRFWRNISPIEACEVKTVTLADFASRIESGFDWLLIDELNSQDILDGAGSCLNNASVVILRCAIESVENQIATDLPGPTLTNLERTEHFLALREFTLLTALPGRHDKLKTAIFVRDWRSAFNAKCSELEESLEHSATTITAAEETISQIEAEAEEHVRTISQLEIACRDAESKQKLAEHNLEDLQSKYRALATQSAKQASDLAKIAEHIAEAKRQLNRELAEAEAE